MFLIVVCALLASIVVGIRLKITSSRQDLANGQQGLEQAKQDLTAAEARREALRGDLETVRVDLAQAQEEARTLREELKTLQKQPQAAQEPAPRTLSEWDAIGEEAARSGDLEDALEAFNQAIKLDPKAAELYYKRGTVRRRLGEFPDAIKDFDHALNLAPRFAPAMVGRGVALANMYKDIRPAVDGANQALQINPELPVALDVRASVLFQIADYQGSLRDDRQLVRLVDSDTRLYQEASRRILEAEAALRRGQ